MEGECGWMGYLIYVVSGRGREVAAAEWGGMQVLFFWVAELVLVLL